VDKRHPSENGYWRKKGKRAGSQGISGMSGSTLKEMFASNDKEAFAKNLLLNYVEDTAVNRKKIVLPSPIEMQKALKIVLEEISDHTALTY
jgi:hypothetical protein